MKGKVDALLVNFLFDAYDFGVGKLFFGAGLGWAQVSEKLTYTNTLNDKSNSGSFKLKKKNNFAYNLMVGSSFKIADGVNLDLKYKWADYGTAKHGKNDDSIDSKKKIHRRGNAVNLGIRFDL